MCCERQPTAWHTHVSRIAVVSLVLETFELIINLYIWFIIIKGLMFTPSCCRDDKGGLAIAAGVAILWTLPNFLLFYHLCALLCCCCRSTQGLFVMATQNKHWRIIGRSATFGAVMAAIGIILLVFVGTGYIGEFGIILMLYSVLVFILRVLLSYVEMLVTTPSCLVFSIASCPTIGSR